MEAQIYYEFYDGKCEAAINRLFVIIVFALVLRWPMGGTSD